MIKGLAAALLAALIVAAIILGIFHFFGVLIGILEWFVAILVPSIIIAAIILFIIIFFFAIIVFFALFYFLAEKKPSIKPGEYKLEDEKGKNE